MSVSISLLSALSFEGFNLLACSSRCPRACRPSCIVFLYFYGFHSSFLVYFFSIFYISLYSSYGFHSSFLVYFFSCIVFLQSVPARMQASMSINIFFLKGFHVSLMFVILSTSFMCSGFCVFLVMFSISVLFLVIFITFLQSYLSVRFSVLS